ncbi:UNVERIFIED_CONTAM: hypothetical protein GTU68_015938 [Idotea baltica]|nr:hypothetical protein [Idotea baltica]
MKRSYYLILIVFLVLLVDQALKIWVKTNLHYYEGFDMLGLSWAKIHFIENEGMAFGITFAGKLILSTFRIIMVSFLIYFIRGLHKAGETFGLLVCLCLILAGAIGNIIDSAFYGLIFSESYHNGGLAQLFPEGGGYASFLHGKVVDMFYFPMIDTRFPEWFPLWGGNRFQFFRPIFNVADASISIGVASILIFHRSFLKQDKKKIEAKQPIIPNPQEE